MEIKCKKTPTTGIQIFIDEEFLTSFSYSPESDEIIEVLESASANKIKVHQLESRIKELESEKSTELIEVFSNTNGYIMKCKSCNEKHITDYQAGYNFCPNCGRKIIKK